MKLHLETREQVEQVLETLLSPGWMNVLLPTIREHVTRVSNTRAIEPGQAEYQLGIAHGQQNLLDGWEELPGSLRAHLDQLDAQDKAQLALTLRELGVEDDMLPELPQEE